MRGRRLALVALAGLGAAAWMVAQRLGAQAPPALAAVFPPGQVPVTHTLALPGGKHLLYADAGRRDGPLVVLIHGAPGTWRDFDGVLLRPELTRRARVVALDRLGWGGSAVGGLAPSQRAQALAVAAVLRALPGNRPAVLVGYSLGGVIAPRVAMDFPGLVDGLVLVGASLDPALEETPWYRTVMRVAPFRWAIPVLYASADAEVEPLQEDLREMLPRWAGLRCPVVVLQGEDDAIAPPGNADFAARVLPAGQVHVEQIAGQGHRIPQERPDRVAAAVLRLLYPPTASATSG